MAKPKKTTVEMIRVTIIGYIPAPGFSLEEFQECDKKLKHLEAFANEQLTDAEFKSRKVGRLIDNKSAEEAPVAEAATKKEVVQEAYRPIKFPPSWAAEEGTVKIEDVIVKARSDYFTAPIHARKT